MVGCGREHAYCDIEIRDDVLERGGRGFFGNKLTFVAHQHRESYSITFGQQVGS